jgi:D-proline reductase (dithiol) PrdB
LIQREIEKEGIPTIGVSIVRQYTEKVKPPRTIFVAWPFGHPFGEAFNKEQQRVVLAEVLRALYTIREPGTIIDLPYRLRGDKYGDIEIRSILSR